MRTTTILKRPGIAWRTLFPLLSLFVVLAGSNAASAQQSTATMRNVVVTANNNTSAYDAIPITGGGAVGSGIFANTNFGTIDAASGTLLLQGGSIQIAESGGEVYNSASIEYVVFKGDLNTTPAQAFSQMLPLTVTSFDNTTNTRTFSLSNAGRSILAQATTGGTPGTTYRFDIGVNARGQDGNGDVVTINSQRRRSQFTVTGSPLFTPTLTNTNVLISPNGAANISYSATDPAGPNPFRNADLGTFDINDGKLVLNGGTATTNENGPNTISNVTLYYRVRLSTSGGGGYMPVNLTQTSSTSNADGSRTRTFALSTAAQNLLASVVAISPPNYLVDVYFQASGVNSTTQTAFTIPANVNADNTYTASFAVNGTPIVVTTWTGYINDNWFDSRNWDNGVPTANTNAVVPNLPNGSTQPYPNIYSNTVKADTKQSQNTNPDGTIDIIPASPGYDNSASGPAVTRNLTLQGSSPGNRSILRLIVGRLQVYGDFDNPQGSFIQRANTVISFTAAGNQNISGSTNGFVNVEIDGGINSIKTLINNFTVKAGGSLKFINGILQTDISRISTNVVTFEGAIDDGSTTIPAAQLIGETNTSYLRGYLITSQAANPGTTQNFSNIGLSLTFGANGLGNTANPGSVQVTRDTGENNTEGSFKNTKPGIRRIFGVQPSNQNTNTGGLNATVAFSYLDNELMNLRTNDGSTTSDDKAKLALYVSTDGGNTYSQLGRDTNDNNTLTKNGVTTFATFTLSEQQTPLPVKLIAFDAKRSGNNALITWATAVEISNSGFEVQVSTNGTTFRKLAFVASQAINSTGVLKYSFLDEENGKTGTRYYRLRQIDEDGKDDFSPVRVVSFSAASATQATTLTAYPNPFNANELPVILVQAASVGDATLQVIDMMGRVITRQSFTTAAGVQEVGISQAANLSSGVYMAKVTLATGEVKTIRIQKR